MTAILADPRASALLALLAGVLFLGAGSLLALPRHGWGHLRRALRAVPRGVGLLAGLVGGGGILALGTALSVTGFTRLFVALLALLTLLVLGVSLPGLEARQHAARRKRLAAQTVDLAGYLVQALATDAGIVSVLRGYTQRPRPAVAALQQLVADVLTAHQHAGSGDVLDQFVRAAEESGCRPLTDVCTAVHQLAQQDRRQVGVALAAQRTRLLEQTILDAKARAQRMEFVLLGISAGSLMFGLLLFILYVMTGGGTLIRI